MRIIFFLHIIMFYILLLVSNTFQCAPHKPLVHNHYYHHHHHHQNQYHSHHSRYINHTSIRDSTTFNISAQRDVSTPSSPSVSTLSTGLATKSSTSSSTSSKPTGDCNSCSSLEPWHHSIQTSQPYAYYQCLAIDVSCRDSSQSVHVTDDHFGRSLLSLKCVEGDWVYVTPDDNQFQPTLLHCK